MSISIIDYLADYLYPDLLPSTPITIILCEEHCLVPDSLKPILLQTLEKSLILKGGLFVYRTGTGFNRGCMAGLALAMCPGSKLYTPRREIYKGIIPNIYLEFLYQPTATPKVTLGNVTASPGKSENSAFEEVYNESLTKFVRTFLGDRAIRAQKAKSLRAQAKNLVDGVIISLGRKYGRSDMVSSDTIVDALFDDFENSGVLKMSFNNVEYNDALIESYFGFNKTKLFEPGFKKTSNSPPKSFDPQTLSSYFTPQPTPSREPYSIPQYSSTTPANPIPSFTVSPIIFPTYQPISQPITNPLLKASPLIAPTPIENLVPHSQSSTLFSTRGGPDDLFPSVQDFSVKKITSLPLIDWNQHDEKITDEILLKVSNADNIDSLLKLFRICRSTIRDYADSNKLHLTGDELMEKVKKTIRLMISTFFESKSLNLDFIIENINISGNTKLTKII